MKAFLSAVIFLAFCGGSAVAQTCHDVTLQASELNVAELKLFDLQGKPSGKIAKSALPSAFVVTECGDPEFVMMQTADGRRLVRVSDLTMPRREPECICPPAGINRGPLGVPLGVPGVADRKYCPVDQCRAR